MIERPSWQDIYGGRIPDTLPPVPRNMTPYVHQPVCPDDCTGRHGVDSEIKCASCRVTAYQDWWHQLRVNPQVNFHRLTQVNGAPQLFSADMPCPVCGGAFRK